MLKVDDFPVHGLVIILRLYVSSSQCRGGRGVRWEHTPLAGHHNGEVSVQQ